MLWCYDAVTVGDLDLAKQQLQRAAGLSPSDRDIHGMLNAVMADIANKEAGLVPPPARCVTTLP